MLPCIEADRVAGLLIRVSAHKGLDDAHDEQKVVGLN